MPNLHQILTLLFIALAVGAVRARHRAADAARRERDATVSHVIEAVVAALIVVHLSGFRMSGIAVLAIIGAAGIAAEKLAGRRR